MDARLAQDPQLLAHYEGLVRKTAGRIERIVEEEFEDICQFLRLKVWQALISFDPNSLKTKPTSREHLEEMRDRYVFSCVQNGKKDVLKKKQHNLLLIDDLVMPATGVLSVGETCESPVTRDDFDHRYLSAIDRELEMVEEELPTIPSTLTESERAVLLLLYLHFKTAEIAMHTSLPRKEINAIVRSIKEKMADWNPAGSVPPAVVELQEELRTPLAA